MKKELLKKLLMYSKATSVMAIVGGALMPPLQGLIIDQGTILSMPAVNFSFILPLICFIAIAIYGYRTYKVYPQL